MGLMSARCSLFYWSHSGQPKRIKVHMPRALNDLLQSLKQSRDGVLPSIQSFPPLDITQIAGELRLEDRAEEQGKVDQPPTDSDLEDVVEGDILAEIERRARKSGEEYRSQLALYDGRIQRALASTDQRSSIEAAGETALTDLKVQAGADIDQLHIAKREAAGREQELEDFRAKHGLMRLPIVTTHRFARIGVLAILTLLEAILNGSFFAAGSESGLIGGFTEAVIFSVFNVGAAFIFGFYGIPLLLHRNNGIRAIGGVSSLFFFAWLLSLNMFIGHYRDLYALSAGIVSLPDVFARLANPPFFPVDAKSLVLIVFGIFVGIATMIDAAGFDDPYLGYGAVGRRREDAVRIYADEKERRLAGLASMRDAMVDQMSQVILLMRSNEYDLRLAVDGRTRLHQEFSAYLDHLADGHFRLLQRYRSVNVRVRSTPMPERFKVRPSVPAFLEKVGLPSVPEMGADAYERVVSRMEHFIRTVNQQFEIEASRYQTVEVLAER